jgi:hypothetical protein
LDRSGEVALLQDGTWDFSIYLLKSGSITRGHGATGGHLDEFLQAHIWFDLPQSSHCFLHTHADFACPQALHTGFLVLHFSGSINPSDLPPPTLYKKDSEFVPRLYKNPAVPSDPMTNAAIPITIKCTKVNFITVLT